VSTTSINERRQTLNMFYFTGQWDHTMIRISTLFKKSTGKTNTQWNCLHCVQESSSHYKCS